MQSVWSWVEVHGETGEWILGSLRHTEKEQQRAQEAEQILKVAIQEEQASTQNGSKNEEEAVGREQAKNRAELGIKMLQELEEPIEGRKRSKGGKNISEIRRGNATQPANWRANERSARTQSRHSTQDENNRVNGKRTARKRRSEI